MTVQATGEVDIYVELGAIDSVMILILLSPWLGWHSDSVYVTGCPTGVMYWR